ncbi:outer membrane-stress sensor serine endopeptidase DegS [Ferrimonas sediminicola]|uniref:Outer membrane-stress sensor serine endopeptidase DegS n=1 Tax=Ferrimonas sediminicola TaxID=2569538 RepID=A0A4V5NY52_9GAMM|nr:outer membrane-stress sensor serine endopeptidase DegS [Ferrimonas sediminicola]TKB51251.1 outer membrane-stress sensor serine endopeptidase DegS [Ferrimonas sediminicola]
MARLLLYIAKPILAGLVLAAAIVLISPNLRQQLPDLNWPTSQVGRNSFAHAVKRASPAVVNIYTRSQNPQNPSQSTDAGLGSGIIMREDGYVLTNYHVVSRADLIYVALQDGRWGSAVMIGADPWTDLAVLYLNTEGQSLPSIPFDLKRTTEVGDAVLAIGNPYNLGQTITQGIVSATGRTGLSSQYQDFIQTDAAINQGNSGGALVDADGYLVGVNTANYNVGGESGLGINFAIPLQLAYKVMQKLIQDGRVIRGHLGVAAQNLDFNASQSLGLTDLQGVVLTGIDRGGPAFRAGLAQWDVVIELNGQPLNGVNAMMDDIAETPPGTEVNLTLIRNGKRLQLPVTIGEKPPYQGPER